MKKIIINGGNELSGTISISGAKNSAVALVPASILCDEIATIDNVPNISDISALKEILNYLGATVEEDNNKLTIDSSKISNKEVPEKIATKLRASYYFMSALLGKFKSVEMYFPGGCNIGARPIDQTLKGYKALGATVIESDNKFKITADKLKGSRIYLDMPSVGATVNIILASVKAEGKTIIENAAKEPEIVNIATFLNNMGAKIRGAGTSTISILGVDYLHKATIETIPDRIEAGTYTIIGALTGKELKIENIIPKHLESVLNKLREMGVPLQIGDDYLIVSKSVNLKPINIKTLGYPGFPTDLQQPFSVILTQANGKSLIEETIYENRMSHTKYLSLMGAEIDVKGNIAKVKGETKLKGEEVVATDLRAGAAMICAGLIADGTTTITEIEHILRGYENIIEKLSNCNADIKQSDK